ncbi:hypothetical protein DE146DRAFT_614489 [Phaeosphaeria sp. MPI-PUGE-AT-0046c]|nr:hypothetical protein DE146DRAFT_614489 [Phaeosphaeria sp. MPI-PUGE-AT-0046c]
MDLPHTNLDQSLAKPVRRARRSTEGDDLEKKPKKVNSEIRKQQNRIASRNYREKRKRKLQYLQQLIKDGPNDEHTPEAVPQQLEAHLRAHSADYAESSHSSPFMLPSNDDFAPSSSPETTALGPAPATGSTAYDRHFHHAAHTYLPFGNTWEFPGYDHTRLPDTIYPPVWTGGIHDSTRMAHQFSPPVSQPAFAQTVPANNSHHGMIHNGIQYALEPLYGTYHGSQSQASIPNVSLPTPSYLPGHYHRPH